MAANRKLAAARASVFYNLALTVLKVAVAAVSGSVSVLMEALHSASDILASLFAFVGVKVSDAPPDEDHPFGHGKAESLAGMAEGLLLLGAAVYVGYEAVTRLVNPEPIEAGLAIWVIGGTAVANVLMGRYVGGVAKETESEALQADASHIWADFVTSIGVLVALVLVRLTGDPIYDPIIALVLSAWILFSAGRILWRVLRTLMDTALPEADRAEIVRILREHPEVKDFHRLRTRKSGTERHIDGHILLRDELNLIEAHRITEDVEDQIRALFPDVSITLHMEPYGEEVQHQQREHGVE
ncbi:MAG: cation diffusion facilitator family transporter [Fimbriimonadales bacterium]